MPATLALMPPGSHDNAEAFIEMFTCLAVLIVVLDPLDERAFEVTVWGVEFPVHPARFHQQHAVGDSGRFLEVNRPRFGAASFRVERMASCRRRLTPLCVSGP